MRNWAEVNRKSDGLNIAAGEKRDFSAASRAPAALPARGKRSLSDTIHNTARRKMIKFAMAAGV